jgi:hypothetical protein
VAEITLNAAGFDTLMKRLDKCVNVSGEYIEKEIFFRFEYVLCFISICDLFTDSPLYLKLGYMLCSS